MNYIIAQNRQKNKGIPDSLDRNHPFMFYDIAESEHSEIREKRELRITDRRNTG
jgi:hypothetical protein